MDPQALALAKAIRRAETGGSNDPYNTKGASGETGAYQFMPDTWNEWSGKYLGQQNAPMTVENQNKVAYSRVKELKDQGLKPAQIASAWNSGNPNAYREGKVGVNNKGVAYDVPAYVSKVSQYYKEIAGQTPKPAPKTRFEVPQNREYLMQKAQEEARVAQKEADKYKGLGFLKEAGKEVLGMIAPGPVGLGESARKVLFNQRDTYSKSIDTLGQTQAQLGQKIREKEARSEDATQFKQLFNQNLDQLDQLQAGLAEENKLPTTKQVIGQASQTGLDVLTAGTYGKAAAGMQTLKRGRAIPNVISNISQSSKFLSPPTVKAVAQGAGIGYGYDVSQSMIENERENYMPGIATLAGAGFAGLGRAAVAKARPAVVKLEEEIGILDRDLSKIEESRSSTRKLNDFTKDGGTASRRRIIESDVLVGSSDETGTISTTSPGGAYDQYKEKTLLDTENVVRKDLEREGATVSLKTIEKKLNQVIEKSSLPALEKESAFKKVQKELKALRSDLGVDGQIALTRLQDEKISNYALIDFNTPAETATYRKAIARAYKEIIEETSKINIKEVNEIIGEYLSDLKRIKALDGAKVKGGRLGKYFSHISGNIIGGAIGSIGGPAGAGAGAMIGGQTTSRIQSILMKNAFKPTGIGVTKSPVLQEAIKRSNLPKVKRVPVASQATEFTDEIPTIEFGKNGVSKFKKADAQLPVAKGAPKVAVPQSKDLGKTNTIYNKPTTTTKKAIPKVSPKKEVKATKVITKKEKSKLKKATEFLGLTGKGTQGGFAKNPFASLGADSPKKPVPKSKVNESVSLPNNSTLITKIENPVDLKTKRDITLSDISGQKVTVPKDTVIQAGTTKSSNMVVEVGGKQYTVNKNQFQNLKGQSLVAEARDFAPELKGTEETIKGASNWKGDELIDNNEVVANLVKNDDGTWSYESDFSDGSDTFKTRKEAMQEAEMSATGTFSPNETKYAQYTLPDGENYREILIKAPERLDVPNTSRDARKALKKEGITFDEDMDGSVYPVKDGDMIEYDEQPKNIQKLIDEALGDAEDAESFKSLPNTLYQSSHWDEPNVISHLRINDRTYKGEKLVFMEELQSDWAREGRSKGLIESNEKLDAEFLTLEKQIKSLTDKYPHASKTRPANVQTEINKMGDRMNEITDLKKTGIPSHPLLKNWQEPTIKRALKDAVENDAKYFAWINGEQTSARYNLATHVKDVEWIPASKSFNSSVAVGKPVEKVISIKPQSGALSIDIGIDNNGLIHKVNGGGGDRKGKKLDEVLGKGLADKIMEKEEGTLAGDGLKFGGEWASNLYNKQVKNIVEDLTGAKVKEFDLGLPVEKMKGNWTISKRINLESGGSTMAAGGNLNINNLSVGKEIHSSEKGTYIITDVLGDGKFKAVQKSSILSREVEALEKGLKLPERSSDLRSLNELSESFDISQKTTKQLGIELTPEIIARVKGEAPTFETKKPSLPGKEFIIPALILFLMAQKEKKEA